MINLKNKKAVVTGATGGIGYSILEKFHSEGTTVLGSGTNEEKLSKLKNDFNGMILKKFDISKHDEIEKFVETVCDELKGCPDILINNAAYARAEDRVPILDLGEDTFQKVMDIKVTGTFLCTKAVVKHMIDGGNGGKIVNISSTAGKKGSANTLAYNGANFAIVGMTQSMARELGPHNINVNAVCPGAVDTHRMDVLGRGDTWNTMADTTPIGRNGTDEEVGDFCAYLCTEAASWIHGQSINQNGGTVMEH